MMPTRKNKTAKETLADNLRLLIGGADSQRAREDLSKKSGVAPRTIGNMLSKSAGNPTLANIEAVARCKGLSVATLLTENLGRSTGPAIQESHDNESRPGRSRGAGIHEEAIQFWGVTIQQ